MRDRRPIVIALYSPLPRSGKGTTAHILRETAIRYSVRENNPSRMCRVHPFAGPLKSMLREFLRLARPDMSRAEVDECLVGPRRTEPLIFGKSARDLMVAMGTYFGRENVDPNIWVHIVGGDIERSIEDGFNVIVDDLRFPQEYDYLHDVHGDRLVTVKLVRPDAPEQAACEGLLEGRKFDHVWTCPTVEDVQANARRLAGQLFGGHK